MSRNALPRPKCSVARSDERNPLARQQRLHLADQRIARLEALEVRLAEQDARRMREGPRRFLHRLRGFDFAAELHEERAPVGDRVHLRRTGQRGGAVISRERRLERAHGLKDLADGVMRFRAFRRREGCALRRVQGLVQPVQLLQRQRSSSERSRMRRRKGEQGVEHMQGVRMTVAYSVGGGEIDVGVGEARVELDRAARQGFGAVIFALIVEQIGQIAVGLGVVGLQRQRGVPALLRLRREAEALEGVGQVVERLGVIRLEHERALDAELALVELQHLLQDDAKVVPGRGKVGRERNRPPARLLTFGQQALLAAHFGEVAEVDRRRAWGSAGLTHVRDGEVEIADRCRP